MSDSSPDAPTGKNSKLTRQRHQWHLLYYVLAAFNLLTVGFTLRLNHQMQEAFTRSVEVSHSWDRRLRDYGDLISTAQAVQARCNDVFITRDPIRQRDEMLLANNAFKARIRAKRGEALMAVESDESRKLVDEFVKLTSAVDSMVETAEDLFERFASDPPEVAARRLVNVNRNYANIMAVLSDLRLRVSGIQTRIFDKQMEEVARLRKMEFIVAALVLVMLGSTVFYGGRITRRMNTDAEALDRAQHELVDTARRAGMAEIATGVLHNVGNVLNSVNVSASLVAESVRKSKVANVERVAKMLSENEAQLGEFLTSDPKGKQVPAFLRTLSTHLQEEQARALKEMDSLAQSLEHVKTIIAMQQNHAKVTGIHEAMSVVDVVEDALRLNAISFTRHEIRVRREFLAKPTATLERHKVMQILVNLLTNAKHALDKPEVKDKTLTVRVALNGHEYVRISVVDTGSGITPESMARLFQHGFTTKPQGHGFGLHHGALAAREMGGSLTAHSDGEGKGATFTLEIPTRPPE
ncbi:MAG: HAMP domain-containing histidine kinase, partial [Verrucomicrobia bacterium]|nr:HAMP domain-containing histidine kinase [Verrucomicrobiota bacterium]